VRSALADEVRAHFDVLDPNSPMEGWMSLKEIMEVLPSIVTRDHRDMQAVAAALRELKIDRGPQNGHTRRGNLWPLTRRSSLAYGQDRTGERYQALGQ
jgi:hypothetical protein